MSSSKDPHSSKSSVASTKRNGGVGISAPPSGTGTASKQKRVSTLLLAHGWLTKRGHKRKNWKRRYVQVGSNGILSYHVSPETRQKGQVNLANASIEAVSGAVFGRDNVFKVKGLGTTNHDELVLQADSEVERDQWMEKLDGWSRSLLYKEGTLLKKLQFRKWKPRKCVINGGVLRYFDEGGDQKGEITLRNFHVEHCEIDEGKKKKQGGSKEKQYCIKLIGKVKKSKVYTLKGISDEETNDWYHIFLKATGENPPERESPEHDQDETAYYESKNGDASFSSIGGASRDGTPMSASELGLESTTPPAASGKRLSREEEQPDSDVSNDESSIAKPEEGNRVSPKADGVRSNGLPSKAGNELATVTVNAAAVEPNSDDPKSLKNGHAPSAPNNGDKTDHPNDENRTLVSTDSVKNANPKGPIDGSTQEGQDDARVIQENGRPAPELNGNLKSTDGHCENERHTEGENAAPGPKDSSKRTDEVHPLNGKWKEDATSSDSIGDRPGTVNEDKTVTNQADAQDSVRRGSGEHHSQQERYSDHSETNNALKHEFEDFTMDEFDTKPSTKTQRGQPQPQPCFDENGDTRSEDSDDSSAQSTDSVEANKQPDAMDQDAETLYGQSCTGSHEVADKQPNVADQDAETLYGQHSTESHEPVDKQPDAVDQDSETLYGQHSTGSHEPAYKQPDVVDQDAETLHGQHCAGSHKPADKQPDVVDQDAETLNGQHFTGNHETGRKPEGMANASSASGGQQREKQSQISPQEVHVGDRSEPGSKEGNLLHQQSGTSSKREEKTKLDRRESQQQPVEHPSGKCPTTSEARGSSRTNESSRKSLRIGDRRKSVPSQPDNSWIRRNINDEQQRNKEKENAEGHRSTSTCVPPSSTASRMGEAPYMHSRNSSPTVRERKGRAQVSAKDVANSGGADKPNDPLKGYGDTTGTVQGTRGRPPSTSQVEQQGSAIGTESRNLNDTAEPEEPNVATEQKLASGVTQREVASGVTKEETPYDESEHEAAYGGSKRKPATIEASKDASSVSSTPGKSASGGNDSTTTGSSLRSRELSGGAEVEAEAANITTHNEHDTVSSSRDSKEPSSQRNSNVEAGGVNGSSSEDKALYKASPEKSSPELDTARSSMDAADGKAGIDLSEVTGVEDSQRLGHVSFSADAKAGADLSEVTGVEGPQRTGNDSFDENTKEEFKSTHPSQYQSPATYAGGRPVEKSERDWSMQSDGESVCTSATLAAQECLEEDAMFAIYRQMSDSSSGGESSSRQWELPEDHPIREQMRQKVADFIQRKAVKGAVNARQSESVQKRLPAFSAVIEQILYNEAGTTSQEDYTSERTLDMRLRRALKQYKRLQKAQKSQAALRSPPPPPSSQGSVSTPASRPSMAPQETQRETSDEINACNSEGPRWGGQIHPWHEVDPSVTIQHYPAEDCDSIHMKLVLTKRPSSRPDLPALNKWQKRRCALCGTTQTTGMFGTPAIYCNYLELLVCKHDFGNLTRPLPWRMVHKLDVRKFKVCKAAAAFLDSIWDAPLVSFPQMAKKVYQKNPLLVELAQVRRDLVNAKERMLKRFDPTECTDPDKAARKQRALSEGRKLLADRLYYPRCENNQFVCFEWVQYLAESDDLLALRDIPAAARGELTLLCKDMITCLEAFINSKSS